MEISVEAGAAAMIATGGSYRIRCEYGCPEASFAVCLLYGHAAGCNFNFCDRNPITRILLGSVPCTQLVCLEYRNSGYLDWRHSACQNEDRIRANCYAKQSCSIGTQGINITVPKEVCETGYPKAKQLVVRFSCVKSDYALDICEDRYETIPSSQSVFLTTPSPDTAAGKASCSCDFKPANQQLFTQNITLIRQRMAHFFNEDYFYYEPAGQTGWVGSPPDDTY
ncbi:hypothetical protein EB796_023012 [Bugula neritina]|uniref:Uncharacterized protein n=1 Tax=Bugula neritina TaxID=10212 RepID=A0A7J7IXM7_BUGNE|nr:hypothetical protein EB796_023012 [Bugula neritina]